MLSGGQTGETWEPSKKQSCLGNRGALDRKGLPHFFCSVYDRAMAEAVSCLPLTAEDRVPSQASSSEVCGRQIRSGMGFYSRTLVFPCQYNSTKCPFSSVLLLSVKTNGGNLVFWFPALYPISAVPLPGQTGSAWKYSQLPI